MKIDRMGIITFVLALCCIYLISSAGYYKMRIADIERFYGPCETSFEEEPTNHEMIEA